MAQVRFDFYYLNTPFLFDYEARFHSSEHSDFVYQLLQFYLAIFSYF